MEAGQQRLIIFVLIFFTFHWTGADHLDFLQFFLICAIIQMIEP